MTLLLYTKNNDLSIQKIKKAHLRGKEIMSKSKLSERSNRWQKEWNERKLKIDKNRNDRKERWQKQWKDRSNMSFIDANYPSNRYEYKITKKNNVEKKSKKYKNRNNRNYENYMSLGKLSSLFGFMNKVRSQSGGYYSPRFSHGNYSGSRYVPEFDYGGGFAAENHVFNKSKRKDYLWDEGMARMNSSVESALDRIHTTQFFLDHNL